MELYDFFMTYKHPSRCPGAVTKSNPRDTFGKVFVDIICDDDKLTEQMNWGEANAFVNSIIRNYQNDNYVRTIRHNIYDGVICQQTLQRIIVTTSIRPKEVLRVIIRH